MHRLTLVAMCLALLSTKVFANPTLDLVSATGNPLILQPGDIATIAVNLSGLEADERLDHLGATVNYDQTLLGSAHVTEGAIIPNPLNDPLDVNSLGEAGLAELSFLTFATSSEFLIRQNGTFFEIEVEARSPGNGLLELTFADASRFNESDPDTPIPLDVVVGPPLPFTVVPEPSAICLLLLGVALLTRARTGRRRIAWTQQGTTARKK